MSGIIFAMALVLTYLAHTYFSWKKGEKSSHATETNEHPSPDYDPEKEITHARLGHFAAQIGHMQMKFSGNNDRNNNA